LVCGDGSCGSKESYVYAHFSFTPFGIWLLWVLGCGGVGEMRFYVSDAVLFAYFRGV